MQSYFKPLPIAPMPSTIPQPSSVPPGLMQTIDLTPIPTELVVLNQSGKIFTGYLSDISDGESMPKDDDHSGGEKEDETVENIPSINGTLAPSSFPIWPPPALK